MPTTRARSNARAPTRYSDGTRAGRFGLTLTLDSRAGSRPTAKKRNVEEIWRRRQEPKPEKQTRHYSPTKKKGSTMGDAYSAAKSLMIAAITSQISIDPDRLIALIEMLPQHEREKLSKEMTAFLNTMPYSPPTIPDLDKRLPPRPLSHGERLAEEAQRIEREILGKEYDPTQRTNGGLPMDSEPWTQEQFAAFQSEMKGKFAWAIDWGKEEVKPMSEREYLFVGGVAAGTRQRVPSEHDHWRGREAIPRLPMDPGDYMPQTAMQEDAYVKVTIGVGQLAMEVYAVQKRGENDTDVAANAAVELLRHYRPNGHDDCRECESLTYRKRMEDKNARR